MLSSDGERNVEEYRIRESIYHSGLVSQESEMTQLRGLTSEILGAYGDASRAALRGALSDGASNMEVLMLRQLARAKEERITQLKEQIEANQFNQHLPAGLALMQKCKALLSENRELGDQIREERLADLRTALQSEQRTNSELLAKCVEAADFCKELTQENDKLQGTISKVAGRLRQARNEFEQLKRERHDAKAKRKKDKQIKAEMAQVAAAAAAATGNVGPGAEVPAAVPEEETPVPGPAGASVPVEVLDDDDEEAETIPTSAPMPPQAEAAAPELLPPMPDEQQLPAAEPGEALGDAPMKEHRKKDKKDKVKDKGDGEKEKKSKKRKAEKDPEM